MQATAPLLPARVEERAELSDPTWINGRSWDVRWLIGSALIVPVVLAFVWGGMSSVAINMGVTALIGGPHLFSTYTATYLDPRFRRSHRPMLLVAGLLVPAMVIFLTIWNFQILLSIFIFAASLHVLQQNAYLCDVYRARAGEAARENDEKRARWSRFVDVGLLMISIYPVASYKLVHNNFKLGDVAILIPPFLMTPVTYWLVWVAFGALLVAWLHKTMREHLEGRLNRPKTLLIAVTTSIAFSVPIAASGERLELAFQAVNAWHSIQYLGLIWYVQKVRKEQGLIDSPMIAKMSGPGWPAVRFYAACFATTAVLFVVLVSFAKLDPLKLSFQQYYYMGVLSCLLIHYALDGYMFANAHRPGAHPESIPFVAPVLP